MKGYEILIGLAGAASAYVLWLLSKMLGDKKDVTILMMEIQFLKEQVKDIKEDIAHLTDKLDKK